MTKEKTMGDFLAALASSAPVPGGGGAAAAGGAIGAALGEMVSNLTIGKKKYADVEAEVLVLCGRLTTLRGEMVGLADRDAEVFAPLAAAYSMPKDTPDQLEEKNRVMEERLLDASLVPVSIMEKAVEILRILELLADKGSRMAVSDVGVGVQFARSALLGAVMNVYINTKSMKNREKADEINAHADELVAEGISLADCIYAKVLHMLR